MRYCASSGRIRVSNLRPSGPPCVTNTLTQTYWPQLNSRRGPSIAFLRASGRGDAGTWRSMLGGGEIPWKNRKRRTRSLAPSRLRPSGHRHALFLMRAGHDDRSSHSHPRPNYLISGLNPASVRCDVILGANTFRHAPHRAGIGAGKTACAQVCARLRDVCATRWNGTRLLS